MGLVVTLIVFFDELVVMLVGPIYFIRKKYLNRLKDALNSRKFS